MLTFQEALDILDEGEVPSIIIANGFSQSWKDDIFNYSNLYSQADFGGRGEVIQSLFEQLGTYDFEAVSKYLSATVLVMRAYHFDEALINRVEEDREILKTALIAAISRTHPDLPSEITDTEYVSVRTFLSGFRKIFSVNYDLLFYWARNKPHLDPQHYSTDDGFRRGGVWVGEDTNQQVYFLHGGLHIYDEGRCIKKHSCTDEGITIIEQVRDNLTHGKFPLFVSEPSAEDKEKRIKHNPYLNFCFRELKKLQGSLFIHGHSLDDNDKHIFDQVSKSNVSSVFVSIYGDENSDANRRTIANAMAYLSVRGKRIVFYDAETASIWR